MKLNLLYANDRRGEYPPSWYAATATPPGPYEALKGDVTADVCVIGAGFTGLSAALHMAEAGRRVVVLEAQRVGFGASGRNGGQLGSGQRMDQHYVEKLVGRDDADKLWAMAEETKSLVKSLVKKHKIDCYLKPGIAHMGFHPSEVTEEHDYADFLAERYGYTHLEKLDRDAAQAICPSPKYVGGSIDRTAAHLHPLAYAFGLARAAHDAGAEIYDGTEVTGVDEGNPATIRTARGRVMADHVVFACNGYLGGLQPKVAARVMPINNFIAATEPLGGDAARVLAEDVAVADSRFVLNYFRLSHDKRLLFGGGETYGYRFPSDIAALVRKPMTEIFPHLHNVRIEYAWGGTLAITMKRLPYLTRLSSNMLSASGYSGHGVGNATHAGKLISDAICGDGDGFDTMSRIPTQPFPGGTALRHPILVLAMTWFALRDRLGV
ncbi:MAG: FAD-binding oxidoreductase [Pseudomonadota bacterium]